jgi:mRNA interferase HicA
MKGMKGSEFIKRIQKFAKERGVVCSWHPDMGKGSHGVLKLNGIPTIVRNPKDELKTGTYHAMLKQLGLNEKDLL